MNNPYSEPSKTEHPSRTAYFEHLMAEVEPVQAPPLESARRRLQQLEQRWAEQEAKDYAEGIPAQFGDFSHEWYALHGMVKRAEQEVLRLESEALK